MTEIIMEEFHLFSEGKMTENYNSINPKTDKFEISLYPSILYAANNLNYSENEKFQLVNDFIDKGFVDFLERFNPIHKCTLFIEYHLNFYEGNKEDFFKHIKFQIIPIIKKRKEKNKLKFDYENLEKVVEDWVDSKREKSGPTTKDKIGLYTLIVAIIGIIVSIVIGWNDILKFINIE